MRALICVIVILIAGTLVGCSDQAAVTGPIQEKSVIQTQLDRGEFPQRFDIDQVVLEPVSGERYGVTGYIDYSDSRDQGFFRFISYANLSLVNIDPLKNVAASISEDRGTKVDVTGDDPVIFSEEYPVTDIAPGLTLRIEYFGSKAVAITAMSLENTGLPVLN